MYAALSGATWPSAAFRCALSVQVAAAELDQHLTGPNLTAKVLVMLAVRMCDRERLLLSPRLYAWVGFHRAFSASPSLLAPAKMPQTTEGKKVENIISQNHAMPHTVNQGEFLGAWAGGAGPSSSWNGLWPKVPG